MSWKTDSAMEVRPGHGGARNKEVVNKARMKYRVRIGRPLCCIPSETTMKLTDNRFHSGQRVRSFAASVKP